MRSFILGYETALTMWNYEYASNTAESLSKRATNSALHASSGVLSRSTLDKVQNLYWVRYLPDMLDVIVDSPSSCRLLSNIKCHKQAADLPKGSLVPVGKAGDDIQVYVTSPELTFVHMATHLCTEELIELGYELCGYYAIAPRSHHGFIDRQPITCRKKLHAFAESAVNVRGAKRARSATKWIVDGSRSPKETNICQLAHMPRRMGGAGIEAPVLNARFELPPEYARLLNARTCSPDMLWEKARMILEYDSKSWHSTEERLEHDAAKRSFYHHLGYECITITKEQLFDFDLFMGLMENLDQQIRLKYGKRKASPASWNIRELQRELHRYLLYGPRIERFTDPALVVAD